MKVVDTNVLLYLYIPGVHTASVEALLREDSEWIAPYLWRSEFRNELTAYVRKTLLTDKQAMTMCNEAEALMDGHEFLVESSHVLDLVFKSKLSAYDCEFIALARQLNVPLVTADKQIMAYFPDDTLTLASFKAQS